MEGVITTTICVFYEIGTSVKHCILAKTTDNVICGSCTHAGTTYMYVDRVLCFFSHVSITLPLLAYYLHILHCIKTLPVTDSLEMLITVQLFSTLMLLCLFNQFLFLLSFRLTSYLEMLKKYNNQGEISFLK